MHYHKPSRTTGTTTTTTRQWVVAVLLGGFQETMVIVDKALLSIYPRHNSWFTFITKNKNRGTGY